MLSVKIIPREPVVADGVVERNVREPVDAEKLAAFLVSLLEKILLPAFFGC